MEVETAVQALEAEWEQIEANGFFGKLRYSAVFDEEGFKRVQTVLNAVELIDNKTFARRFIEVTRFIPTFMRWQRDAWQMDGKNTQRLDEAITYFEQRLTTILGLP